METLMENKKVHLWELLSRKTEYLDLSKVLLTEEEKSIALSLELTKKQNKAKLQLENVWNNKLMIEIAKNWDSTEMLHWIQWRFYVKNGFDMKMDEYNHETIKALCRYFTNDKRFEQMGEGWRLDKGLILCGTVGTGKTTIMNAFSVNKKSSYQVISSRLLADKFATIGPEIMHTYSKLLNVASSMDLLYQKQIGICFDDLGTEREGKRFGDTANVMEQIILNRYDLGAAPWWYTHITTNLIPDEIENMYGTRVRSRMREMFNVIPLIGNDRRQ